MPLRLMVSQGRIDDRSPNAVLGAALTAEVLAKRLGLDPNVIGRPSPHQVDDWRKSLPAAEATLAGIAAEVGQPLPSATCRYLPQAAVRPASPPCQ